MDKYRKIIEQVRSKGDKKAKKKELDAIVEVMCLSIDESPHMIALADGAAILSALYTLCMDDNFDTRGGYLEIRDRLVYLVYDMYDKMSEKYPSHTRAKSEKTSEPDVTEAIERLRAISTEEDRHDLDG